MKLGIIIDSSAGLTKAEADKRGWGLLPLYLSIDGKDYADGIDITPEKYYSTIKLENDVRTSATPPGVIMDMFEEFSKKYDQVLVYGLSKSLSSQSNNLMTFSGEFKNIHVVESKGVGYSIVRDLEIAETMAKDHDIESIVKKMNILSAQHYGLLLPATMQWLVKGGRVSNSAAQMANLLKIVPIIAFKDGGLDKYGKGRVFSKAVIKTAIGIKEESGASKEIIVYHGQFNGVEEIISELKNVLGDKALFKLFPPIVANHTGPEVIGIMTRKK